MPPIYKLSHHLGKVPFGVSGSCFPSSSVTLHACWFLFALSCCTLYKNPLYAPAPHPRHIFPLIPLPPFPFHCSTRTLRIPSGGKKMELNSHSSSFFFFFTPLLKSQSLLLEDFFRSPLVHSPFFCFVLAPRDKLRIVNMMNIPQIYHVLRDELQPNYCCH